MMRSKIIKLINDGVSLKEISETLNVSYNTVRQTATSLNLLNKFSSFLNGEQIYKLEVIGNNIRALSPLKDDKEALVTVIDYIDTNTTRKEIEDLVSGISEIKGIQAKLINRYDKEVQRLNRELEVIKESIRNIKDIDTTQLNLNEQFSYVRNIPDKNVKKGYLNILGLKIIDNRLFYSLAKRVNLNLWNKLRREHAIIPGTNEIIDMEKFITLTINTMKRNNYYSKAEKERNVLELNHMTIQKQIEPYLLDLDSQIVEYTGRIQDLQKKIVKSGNMAIQNYFSEREFRNNFTKIDSVTHSKILRGACKWLYNNKYIPTVELPYESYQFDVVGYSTGKEIVILEAKVSPSDLKADSKINNYMNYCDKLFLVSHDEYVCKLAVEILDIRIGIIRLNSNFGFYEVIRTATFLGNGNITLIENINKKNARYFIYGK